MDQRLVQAIKRKHDSPTSERPSKAAKTSGVKMEPAKVYASEIEAILDRGQELVHNALKLVRRFERQKLSRRAKTADAEKNEKDIKRIEDEIKALNVRNLVFLDFIY
jgi:hypothetical protein